MIGEPLLGRVGDELRGIDLPRLPAGSVVELVASSDGRRWTPTSALLRMVDGTWRAADRDDTSPPNIAATFRILFLGRGPITPEG